MWKRNDDNRRTTPVYWIEDFRKDVFVALEKAKGARIHYSYIERALHGIADGEAQRRAMTEPAI
jgi:hypothetical protein